jgi:hypothetical protein
MLKVLSPLSALLERYLLPLLLVVAFLLYRRFSWFFDKDKQEDEKKEQQAAEHENALAPDYVTPSPGASAAVVDRIAKANAEKAKLYKQAEMAERISKLDFFVLTPWYRERDLLRLAAEMKERNISLSGTAAQYRKLTGNDLYRVLRRLLNDSYIKFINLASHTK